MSQHIITFAPNGIARCLWTEAVPLHEIGRLQIRRATTIEFNNANQHWEVKDRKGKVRFFARSRSTCLEWEHEIQGSILFDSTWQACALSWDQQPPIG